MLTDESEFVWESIVAGSVSLKVTHFPSGSVVGPYVVSGSLWRLREAMVAEMMKKLEASRPQQPDGPQFTHDSKCCTFLGRWRGPRPHAEGKGEPCDYDLYWCGKGIDCPTVLSRYGDDGPEYNSDLVFAWRAPFIPALVEAKNRAKARGLDVAADKYARQ